MKAQLPLMSIGASGSFAGALVASTWKGRPYLRQLVTPSNPKSAMQTAFRAMFKFLGQTWKNITFSEYAFWETLAKQGNYSTFNAYMKYNQDRWARTLAPVTSPDNIDNTAPTFTSFTATAGVRSVTLEITVDTLNDGWGTVIYMEAGSAPEGTQDEVIIVAEFFNAPNPLQILITDLTPGTAYHFKHKAFTTGGTFNAISADVNATPTT